MAEYNESEKEKKRGEEKYLNMRCTENVWANEDFFLFLFFFHSYLALYRFSNSHACIFIIHIYIQMQSL